MLPWKYHQPTQIHKHGLVFWLTGRSWRGFHNARRSNFILSIDRPVQVPQGVIDSHRILMGTIVSTRAEWREPLLLWDIFRIATIHVGPVIREARVGSHARVVVYIGGQSPCMIEIRIFDPAVILYVWLTFAWNEEKKLIHSLSTR